MAWDEPDPEVLDRLTQFGCFAADPAVLAGAGMMSSMPHPDGLPQPLTGAEVTRLGLRAALRMLLANGLIVLGAPKADDDYIYFDPPPS